MNARRRPPRDNGHSGNGWRWKNSFVFDGLPPPFARSDVHDRRHVDETQASATNKSTISANVFCQTRVQGPRRATCSVTLADAGAKVWGGKRRARGARAYSGSEGGAPVESRGKATGGVRGESPWSLQCSTNWRHVFLMKKSPQPWAIFHHYNHAVPQSIN